MNASSQPIPRWFWVVAVLITLWMCVGVMAFAMDLMMDETTLAALPEAQRTLYETRPSWLIAVYAVATLGGVAGAIGLLMKKAWAVPALLISLVAVIVQFGTVMLVMDAIALLGAAEALTFPAVIVIIGAASWWFGTVAKQRGWLA